MQQVDPRYWIGFQLVPKMGPVRTRQLVDIFGSPEAAWHASERELREAGLPEPVTNRKAGAKRVDCRWPQHNLTVELDSYRYHSSRHAWEQDRRREREAYARDDDFRRDTHDDVFEAPEQMLRELSVLLRVGRR